MSFPPAGKVYHGWEVGRSVLFLPRNPQNGLRFQYGKFPSKLCSQCRELDDRIHTGHLNELGATEIRAEKSVLERKFPPRENGTRS